MVIIFTVCVFFLVVFMLFQLHSFYWKGGSAQKIAINLQQHKAWTTYRLCIDISDFKHVKHIYNSITYFCSFFFYALCCSSSIFIYMFVYDLSNISHKGRGVCVGGKKK